VCTRVATAPQKQKNKRRLRRRGTSKEPPAVRRRGGGFDLAFDFIFFIIYFYYLAFPTAQCIIFYYIIDIEKGILIYHDGLQIPAKHVRPLPSQFFGEGRDDGHRL
jgi:hypothetical protein